jgi:stage II sporulation SpoAA-like protein
MIEIIEGLPDYVVGIVVRGRVTKKDCSDILVPVLEKSLEWHHRLRLYYEIRSRYPGAAWEEITLGNEYAPVWERVAVVTDVAWMRHTVQAVRLLIPAEIRVFATTQVPEGLVWITGLAARRPHSGRPPAVSLHDDGRRLFQPPVQYLRQAR